MAEVGGLFDVGGHRLYLRCQGAGHPTVVLEAGLGDGPSLGAWELLEPLVASFTEVCSYDRAGLGRSEFAPAPRTGGRMVEELHTLLAVAGVPPPYVLVGHSFGGIIVRLFAARYPHTVAGLVLVDPSHEEGQSRMLELLRPDEREVHMRNNPEGVDWQASATELSAAGPLPAMPVVLVSRGQPALAPKEWPQDRINRWEEIWRELQSDLAHRIPATDHIIAAHSRHYAQRFEPHLVARFIRDIVDGVRLDG